MLSDHKLLRTRLSFAKSYHQGIIQLYLFVLELSNILGLLNRVISYSNKIIFWLFLTLTFFISKIVWNVQKFQKSQYMYMYMRNRQNLRKVSYLQYLRKVRQQDQSLVGVTHGVRPRGWREVTDIAGCCENWSWCSSSFVPQTSDECTVFHCVSVYLSSV